METTGRRGRAGTSRALTGLIGIAVLLALAPVPARAADDHWDDGRHWVSVRAGFAKSRARLAPGGSFGYGFGYTWFLSRNLAWAASVGHDLLGRFDTAAEIEVPITTEFTKHFQWSAQTRPYLGLGWGAIYHKTYRTGVDESGFRQGIYVATGANSSLSADALIGLDLRWMLEQDTRSLNPTFPNSDASSSVLSAKISFSRAF
jgi:hypothetical protein